MSVRVNNIFFPFQSTPDLMQRFVRPALFSTGEALFEVRVFGTALMARYRNWNFALATAHQVDAARGAPPAESFVVVIDYDGKQLAVPPSAVYRPRVEEEEFRSLHDLAFFDYSKVAAGYRPRHLDLSDLYWSDSTAVTPDYSFVIGYPSRSMRIEFDPDDDTRLSEFAPRWIRQDLQAANPAPLDTEHRLIFVKHEQSTLLSVDPDGLSGSPVFSIVQDLQQERHLRFDGIVTNAREDRFAVFPSAFIRSMLDKIVT